MRWPRDRNEIDRTQIFQPIFSDEEKFAEGVVGDSDSETGSVFDLITGAEGGYTAESPSDNKLDDLVDEENNGTNDEEEDGRSVISMGNGLVLRECPKSRNQRTKSATAINTTTPASGAQNLLSVLRP
jgi:hypothetical protein